MRRLLPVLLLASLACSPVTAPSQEVAKADITAVEDFTATCRNYVCSFTATPTGASYEWYFGVATQKGVPSVTTTLAPSISYKYKRAGLSTTVTVVLSIQHRDGTSTVIMHDITPSNYN